MLIRNVLPHPDDLHDGRPFPAYETVEINDEDFQLEHYQARFHDGLIAVISDEAAGPQTVEEVRAAIDAAPEQDREALKASLREREKASGRPRQGVLDATKPNSEEGE